MLDLLWLIRFDLRRYIKCTTVQHLSLEPAKVCIGIYPDHSQLHFQSLYNFQKYARFPCNKSQIQLVYSLHNQKALPGLLGTIGFLTTLPPEPRPAAPLVPFRAGDDEDTTPPTRRGPAAGRRTSEPTSTSLFRLAGWLRSASRCFSASARSRSAAIWDSISMRRLNSCSVTRRSR